jgi:hypothetical protein
MLAEIEVTLPELSFRSIGNIKAQISANFAKSNLMVPL